MAVDVPTAGTGFQHGEHRPQHGTVIAIATRPIETPDNAMINRMALALTALLWLNPQLLPSGLYQMRLSAEPTG